MTSFPISIATAPSTTLQTTTEKVCDENLDNYEAVVVTRTNEDGSPLAPGAPWKPTIPSEFTTPYSGSPMTVTFTPRSEVTSVTVYSDDETDNVVFVAFEVKPSDREDFVPLVNSDGTRFFMGTPGIKIGLPLSTPYVVEIKVYIVNPKPTSSFEVIFNGCEHRGKYF